MRSVWKGNFYKIKDENLTKNSTILNFFLNKSIDLHNGKTVSPLIIEREMIGKKAGEFAFSRKLGSIHVLKKKKNKGGSKSSKGKLTVKTPATKSKTTKKK